jgi:response regulator RpfG family c-di-GMP phosphodiesterase
METRTKPIEVIFTDDDEDDLEFFRQALGMLETPTNLNTFRDGDKMMKFLERKKDPLSPDIIFLDINMPKKDGLTCLLEMRSKPRFQKIPIIMFTTSLRPVDVQQSYIKGANLFIKKPSGFNELVTTMRKLFSKQWLGRLMNMEKVHLYRPDIPDNSKVYSPILSPDISEM